MRVVLVGALVAATFFTSFGVLHYGVFTRKLLRDTPVYERYGDAVVHRHRLPYRDFALEYPPGALPVFVAPSLAARDGDLARYSLWFELEMLACGAVAAALTGFLLAKQSAGRTRLVAGTLLAGLAPYQLWGYAVSGVSSHGSDNLAGRLPDALATAQFVLVGAVLLALWYAFARGPATGDRLLRYSAAASPAPRSW